MKNLYKFLAFAIILVIVNTNVSGLVRSKIVKPNNPKPPYKPINYLFHPLLPA